MPEQTGQDMGEILPLVSVVIPTRNEEKYIENCLAMWIGQDYPSERIEILVVDGMSDDNTRAIVNRLASETMAPSIRVIDNPDRITPCALNRGVEEACGDVIIIFGAHSHARADYASRVVTSLQKTGAGAVGGRWEEIGLNPMGNIIGAARKSLIGGAISAHRFSNKPGFVDTVRFAGYRREVFRSAGLFDVELIRNQDDEFNYRVRKAGYRLYFDPHVVSTYYTRGSLKKLFSQMYQYGYWKPRVLQKNPQAFQFQFFVPSAFVLSVVGLGFCSLWWGWTRFLLAADLMAYLAVTLGFSAKAVLTHGLRYGPGVLVSLWIIHIGIGTGTLAGLKQLTVPLKPAPAYAGARPSQVGR